MYLITVKIITMYKDSIFFKMDMHYWHEYLLLIFSV